MTTVFTSVARRKALPNLAESFNAGKSEEAWDQLRSALELHPNDYYANRILMYVAQAPEQCRHAIEEVKRVAGLTSRSRTASSGALGVLYARLGERRKLCRSPSG